MEESLIDKYPHLKTLLEGQDKSANGQSAEGRETVRKSILGPGVGPVKSARAAAPARKNITPGQKKLPAKADELFARSKGADKDHWLNFKIDESLAARQQMEPLKLWLVTNKPSEVTRESGVGWISVKLGQVCTAHHHLLTSVLTQGREEEGQVGRGKGGVGRSEGREEHGHCQQPGRQLRGHRRQVAVPRHCGPGGRVLGHAGKVYAQRRPGSSSLHDQGQPEDR